MDIDPIQERTSSINKIIIWFRSLFKKKEPDHEKIIQTIRENAKKNYEAFNKFDMSVTETSKQLGKAGKAFAQFNKFMTPNQMREILNKETINDTTCLYADDKLYCIIDEKGDPIWTDKTK